MKKFALSLTAASMILGGLAGCGVDNQGADMGARQVGMNTQATDQTTGTATRNDTAARGAGDRWTGEGPLTDMMTPNRRDAGAGLMGENVRGRGMSRQNVRGTQTGQREGIIGQTGNHRGQGVTGANQDRRGTIGQANINQRPAGTGTYGGANVGMTGQRQGMGAAELDGRRATQDAGGRRTTGLTGQRGTGAGAAGLTGNRTGMVDNTGTLRGQAQNRVGTGTANYHQDYDSQAVQRITDRVNRLDNVNDPRVIVNDNTVVVGIDGDGQDRGRIESQVREAVREVNNDYDVHVVTDRDGVNRIRTMDDRLRGGAAFDEVGATFREMIGDLGRAAQRPFERSR
ncbi:YhcN/YlaJ family sporulation lipoprotein [Desertibacillus haloalkaliphilus]|uniref:YhcN/YlaJ family sporulation lipoprotein n=1 Tax=Desertibacillus haloalkaliphilus TaxID=1328930 RepID=UPI001C253FCC|nr:YhcN/YlaJ family sporulation lipoprotein [Desertibacillus haloalkaliphilus]MBU8905489.1 YhcN/YlaJ family sporulation lipoprotein [Desertibacillus haloalkaliphilus]